MPLVLIYRGALPSNGNTKDKHHIRRAFHAQLSNAIRKPYAQMFRDAPDFCEHPVGQFRFHPLICRHPFYPRIGCELEIHALSHDPYGSVIQSGDLDNRLKTLFDALRLPSKTDELPQDAKPQDGDAPFWVLLSDDRIITDLHVKQDILHTSPSEGNSYMELIIRVTVRPGDIV